MNLVSRETTPPLERARDYSATTTGLIVLAEIALIIVSYGYLLRWDSGDIRDYLLPWLEGLLARGRLDGISGEFSNYSPPYLYVLSAASMAVQLLGRFGVIKAAALLGVVACACSVFYLARLYHPRGGALLVALGYCLVPTVALNAAAWGQADALYAGPVVCAVADSIRERWARALSFFGIALAIKLQALFIAPFLLFGFVSRRFSPLLAGCTVATFAAMLVPAWIAGRPAADLATIYAGQASYFHRLSMNSPNVWHLIQRSQLVDYRTGVLIGLCIAAAAGLAIGAAAFLRSDLGRRQLLVLAVLSAVVMPYLLPKMHDRYFYIGEVLAFVLMCTERRLWTVTVFALLQLGALNAYAWYFFRTGSTSVGALLNSVALLILFSRCLQMFRPVRWREWSATSTPKTSSC